MNMNPMYDNVRHVLYRDACTVSYVDVDATTIYRLEAVHDEFLLQCYDHVAFEDDPKRLDLDHGVTECTRFRVNRVIVVRVAYYVVTSVSASYCVASEADCADGEVFSPELPFPVTTPAIVDGVTGGAREVT